MLEAIADFWKPVRRLQAQSKLKTEELQIGSSVQFGFVPQQSLSGRKFTVSAINTYKFGVDILTSFVMTQEKDAGVSMIIADAGGEYYIAVSRRLSISDRNKLFLHDDLEAIINDVNTNVINCNDVAVEYKNWIAPHYKREIHDVKGHLYRGDHRNGLITGDTALEFSYNLLVSDNNEQALEIEKHLDGRIEVYATVYRRMSDISDVVHPQNKEIKKETIRPDVKLVSGNDTIAAAISTAKPEPKLESTLHKAKAENEKTSEPSVFAESAVNNANVQSDMVTSPIELPEFPAEAVAKKVQEEQDEKELVEERKEDNEEEIVQEELASISDGKNISKAYYAQEEQNNYIQDSAGVALNLNTALVVKAQIQPFVKQEIKAVNKEINNFVNESIDCELHVANRIIDEAIRNEMRINDVVRRVIGLPVSQQESVQIPVTLTDQDYALLAIRYGISSGDHEAIKRRIIEDLGDFSGIAKKDKKAA